ncbi:MAG TPA: hypothetical protein VEC02_03275 [Nitrososphaerales archaeon]|nr:hypothetical protein [Nitrososphaerales archaeon]
MNAKIFATATIVGVVAIVAMLFAYPAVASSIATTDTPSIQQLAKQQSTTAQQTQQAQLAAGQTMTLTGVAGGYRVVGDRSVNGTASGSLVLLVTGVFKGGYALSVTGGSITLNGTTYTVSGGSGELGPRGIHMVGQGQTGNGGKFLFDARNLGSFGNASYGILRIDLTNGGSEFAVRLLVTFSS